MKMNPFGGVVSNVATGLFGPGQLRNPAGQPTTAPPGNIYSGVRNFFPHITHQPRSFIRPVYVKPITR
jgi:hypothetical protein